MKFSAHPTLLLFALSLATTSCSVVTSKQLVGSEPYDEAAEFAGQWIDADGEKVSVSIDAKEPGKLHLSSDSEEVDKAPCYVRKTGNWVFLNLGLEAEDGEETEWIWLVAKLQDGGRNLLLWLPDADQFAELVRAKKIPGTVEEEKGGVRVVEQADGTKEEVRTFPSTRVTIDGPGMKWTEDLATGKLGVPFDWQEPVIYRRVDEAGKELPSSVPAPSKEENE